MDLIMNKNDFKLIIIIGIIILLLFIIISANKREGNTALVYYEDEVIMMLDLNINKEYTVKGYLGDVIIEVRDKKVRVKEEVSPKHLCSKEGYTNSSLKPIICLPNKIIIKVIDNEEIDGVVY